MQVDLIEMKNQDCVVDVFDLIQQKKTNKGSKKIGFRDLADA